MNEEEVRRILPDQSSGSGHTFGTSRHPSINNPILSKKVCFYKSGDPQFSGLRLVINNRTFKTFDALLDSLSKKVPLPFGVRNITTPRGVHAISTLDQLEDGKAYICSDSRKVKPINLAQARKKLPPWYHARPVSSHRRNVQKARFFPGHSIHKQEQVVVRTPKRLTVFRNGDPTERHTVILHKKTTPSYVSILECISQLMQFHVVKLLTPDGTRVDGLPGLILCSGIVVAVGREQFKPALYSSTKAPPSAWQHTRRQKALNRKKRVSYRSKLRNFSTSSERHIVHQIHNTIAERALPSIPTNSIEMDSNRILESVAETEDDTCIVDGIPSQQCSLPNEDDIEKSFKVNQDGSMTVEMKVRLTLKEEETIHWTTTLSRSSTANNLASCLAEPETLIGSSKPNSVDLQTSAGSSLDSINKENVALSSQCNGAFSEFSNEENDTKNTTDVVFPCRTSAAGLPQQSKKQTSVESITSLTKEGIHEQMLDSYSYQEHTGNGTITEQFCMVKQSSGRPVPKPRRLGSLDVNHTNPGEFKSTGLSEMMQIESSGVEEVTETVLHIYEQHSCHDNFLANYCANSMSATGVALSRPATSENRQHYCSDEFKPELCRPSTASESVSIWRAESNFATSDETSTFLKTDQFQAKNGKKKSTKAKKVHIKLKQIEVSRSKKLSTKPKVINKHVRQLLRPGKRQTQNAAGATRTPNKPKTFSSAGFIKRIYGNKQKSPKKSRKMASLNRQRSVTTTSLSDDTRRNVVHNSEPTVWKKRSSARVRFSSADVNLPRAALTRQTSIHMEKQEEIKDDDVSDKMALPNFISSSSLTKEYVENWLEKARPQTDNSSCEETEVVSGLNTVLAERNCLMETSNVETSTLAKPLSKSVQRTLVKMRVESIETYSTSPTEEKTASQQGQLNTDNSKGFTQDAKPLVIGIDSKPLPPIKRPQKETAQENVGKYTLQEARPSSPLLDLPPPSPDELEGLSSTDNILKHASLETSNERPDTHILPVTSILDNIPRSLNEESLTRAPSIKRAPLVSNLSFERKMSLRKANLDKHTQMAASANNSQLRVLPNGTCLIGTSNMNAQLNQPEGEKQQGSTDVLSYRSGFTSVSPSSSTSEERESSPSITSIIVSAPSSLTLEETPQTKTLNPTSNDAASPKTSVKKVRLRGSPSPERKTYDKKSSSGLQNTSSNVSSLQSHPAKATTDVGSKKATTLNMSPSTERDTKLSKQKLKNRLSPYSQSLNIGSPPVRHKPMRKLLSRNLSLQNPAESTNKKKQSARKSTLSGNSTDKTCDTLSSAEDGQRVRFDLEERKQDKSPEMQLSLQPFTTTNQPNLKPILKKICYSIKSIRNMTQSKRPSCLEKSNSLPDFSSHIASTFGSSSKALLAFLSIMTLKEGITSLHMDQLNANNVSCAEALKMIDSLKEIANIEDSQKLKDSLSRLQQSASKQLLQSWSGFQEINNRCKSQSSIKSTPEPELDRLVSLELENSPVERAIDELMESLEVPDMLKEELASFSEAENGNREGNKLSPSKNSDGVGNQDDTNVDVRNIIKKFSKIHEQEAVSVARVHQKETLKSTSQACKDQSGQSVVIAEELGTFQQKGHKNKVLQGCIQSNQNCSEAEHSKTDQHRSEDLSNHEVYSEKEQTESHQSCFVELPIKGGERESDSAKNKDGFLSEETHPATTCKKLSSNSQQEPQSFSMGFSVSIDESTGNSDFEPSSEEEKPEVEPQNLQIIIEEKMSGNEEEEEEKDWVYASSQVEDQKCPHMEASTEQTEKNHFCLKDRCEKIESKVGENQSHGIQNRKSSTNKEKRGSLKSKKPNTDGDSGNDHSTCEENRSKVEEEQISTSLEEELSYFDKESSSEEERIVSSKQIKDSTEHHILIENKIISQSVAERVILLEKQATESQKTNYSSRSSPVRCFSQRNARLDSDIQELSSESPTSLLPLCTRSAPQSSLSFSYDSSAVITTEPERDTVRSIRDMFLAKHAIDVQPRRLPRPNSSILPKIRAETSVSGGYQSQTSGDLSSSEEDSPRRSITKGFVRRTIERLYGKKDTQPDKAADNGAPSEPKHKNKEHPSIFSSLQAARSKAMTELYYFNSTDATQTFTEAKRCIAFNAQVGPEDGLSIDNGHWLLKENNLIKKSISDPVGINKTPTNSPESKETKENPEENPPYSLFSSKTEEQKSAFSRKCTYFSLPHGSDSEVCQDDVTKGGENEESIIELDDISKDTKLLKESNSRLPAVGDIRLRDNKVHPMGNPPTDGDVVIQQPGKGQAVVNRQLYEPDMLDFLYNFCGQNCPIL